MSNYLIFDAYFNPLPIEGALGEPELPSLNQLSDPSALETGGLVNPICVIPPEVASSGLLHPFQVSGSGSTWSVHIGMFYSYYAYITHLTNEGETPVNIGGITFDGQNQPAKQTILDGDEGAAVIEDQTITAAVGEFGLIWETDKKGAVTQAYYGSKPGDLAEHAPPDTGDPTDGKYFMPFVRFEADGSDFAIAEVLWRSDIMWNGVMSGEFFTTLGEGL